MIWSKAKQRDGAFTKWAIKSDTHLIAKFMVGDRAKFILWRIGTPDVQVGIFEDGEAAKTAAEADLNGTKTQRAE